MAKQFKKTLFKGSLPILILAGVVLFLALTLELVRLTVFSETGTHLIKAKMEENRTIPQSENIFANIHKQYPTYEEALKSLNKYNLRYVSHNYVKGNHKSNVKVFIFNDNDCGICRKEQARILRMLEPFLEDIVIVFKHMPTVRDQESLSAMFGQIAVREGLYEEFLQELLNSKKELESAEDYFELLNKIGISLDRLRSVMKTSMTDVLREVGEDIEMAVNAGAYNARNQPVIYINGYRIGADYLPQHRLTTYIERLINGEEIIPNDGFEDKEDNLAEPAKP